MIRTIAVLGAAAAFAAYVYTSDFYQIFLDRVTMLGPFDPKNIERVQKQIEQLDSDGSRDKFLLHLSSTGGDSDALLKLVELTRGRLVAVVVTGNCFSACAEFVQLVDAPVRVGRNAVVGFHGNALIHQAVVEDLVRMPGDWSCYRKRAGKFRAIMAERGADADVTAREVMRRVRYVGATRPPPTGGCDTAQVHLQYRLWLPTSKQLREVFKIDLINEVCTDDPECLHPRLRELWGDKPAVVVGDAPLLTLPKQQAA